MAVKRTMINVAAVDGYDVSYVELADDHQEKVIPGRRVGYDSMGEKLRSEPVALTPYYQRALDRGKLVLDEDAAPDAAPAAPEATTEKRSSRKPPN